METIEYYMDNKLIATSQANRDTPLVDIAASIKGYLDTTQNRMGVFTC